MAKFGVVTDEELDQTPTISPDCFGCDMEMVPEARQPVPDGVSPTGRYRLVASEMASEIESVINP